MSEKINHLKVVPQPKPVDKIPSEGIHRFDSPDTAYFIKNVAGFQIEVFTTVAKSGELEEEIYILLDEDSELVISKNYSIENKLADLFSELKNYPGDTKIIAEINLEEFPEDVLLEQILSPYFTTFYENEAKFLETTVDKLRLDILRLKNPSTKKTTWVEMNSGF